MMVGAGREVAGKEERAVDITDISDKQTEIDKDINDKWGNGSPTLLSGTITNSSISTSGDAWYYLNGDITANTTGSTFIDIIGNVRIVLNGYSISGSFKTKVINGNATLSIFDKIPGKSGTGYTYNSNAVKYYKYNSSTGGYTDYSTSVPSGTNVTDMPTFKADSYIKVTGSALSPNSVNSDIMTLYLGAWNGILNLYGINVLGCIGNSSVIVFADMGGTTNLYQCTVIGNSPNDYAGAVGTRTNGGIVNMQGCKVYGNKTSRSDYGMQPSDTNLPQSMLDVGFNKQSNSSKVNIYKCNVGAISSTEGKFIYVKDVNFGNETATITNNTLSTFFAGTNNISGTIELVYNCTTNYASNSPNLNFIVHGNDSDSNPKKGKNSLIVSGTCGNISTVFDNTTVVTSITINGTCSGISTRGNVTIGSNGSATIPTGKSVGGTVTNNGRLTLAGSVTNLTNNGNLVIPQGKSYTISSGQTLGGMLTNQGTLIVNSGATVTNSIDNAGTLNVSGTVSNVYGYGGINVNTNGNVAIPAGKEAGRLFTRKHGINRQRCY